MLSLRIYQVINEKSPIDAYRLTKLLVVKITILTLKLIIGLMNEEGIGSQKIENRGSRVNVLSA